MACLNIFISNRMEVLAEQLTETLRSPLSSPLQNELVIVQKSKDHTWPNGDFVPAHERMPSSEQWGTYGWSYSNLPSALSAFDQKVISESKRTAKCLTA